MVVVVQAFFVGAASAKVSVGDLLNFDPGLGSNGGGEFKANVVTGTSAGTSFQTFCIERTETLDFSANFRIGAITQAGLHNGTALLFRLFSDGTLLGYDGDAASQTALQLSLWFFQGQLAFSPDLTAQYLGNAEALAYTAIGATSTKKHGVQILKMQRLNGTPAQDVLITPEPASMLAWALIGGCFVAGHRIRRGKWL
jgi:hypothetical protein